MKYISKVLDVVFHYDLNVFKTIIFNLKVFGFKRGWRMPVFLFGKIDLQYYYRGCIVLSSYSICSVRIGGGFECYLHGRRPHYPTIINIKGKAIIGQYVMMGNGMVLSVGKLGCLKVGNNCLFNVKNRIYCEKEIIIEENTRVSWDVQLFDSNFHYTETGGRIKPKNASIYIGHHVWIGNRVTISKGVLIPNSCVISANSFVNKDFSFCNERSLIGGVPAKYICSNIARIHDFGFEYWLDKYFINHNTPEQADYLFNKYQE